MVDQKKVDSKRDDERLAGADAAAGVDAAPRAGPESHAASGRAYPGVGNYDTRGDGAHIVQSAGAAGSSAVGATRDVLRGAIGATEDVASGLVGGVTHVATDIVHGVHHLGLEVRDGASGLIGAAGTVGGTAVHTVADLLADVVGGVRHIVSAAMGHDGDGMARRADIAASPPVPSEPHEAGVGAMPPPGSAAARDSGASARS